MRRLCLLRCGPTAQPRLIRGRLARFTLSSRVHLQYTTSAGASPTGPAQPELTAPTVHTYIGTIRSYMTNNPQKALKSAFAFAASGLDTTSHDATLVLCSAFAHYQHWDRVIYCIKKCMDTGADVSDIRSRMMRVAAEHNNLDALEALIQLFPVSASNTLPPVIFAVFFCLLNGKRTRAARELFTAVAASRPPICWDIYSSLIQHYPASVILEFDAYTYLHANTDWTRIRHIAVLVTASLIYHQNNSITEAAALIRRALEANPTFTLSHIMKQCLSLLKYVNIRNDNVSMQTIVDLLTRRDIFPELSPVVDPIFCFRAIRFHTPFGKSAARFAFLERYLQAINLPDPESQQFILNVQLWRHGFEMRYGSNAAVSLFNSMIDQKRADVMTFWMMLLNYRKSADLNGYCHVLDTLINYLPLMKQIRADQFSNLILGTARFFATKPKSHENMDSDACSQKTQQLLMRQLYNHFKEHCSSSVTSDRPQVFLHVLDAVAIFNWMKANEILAEWHYWMERGVIPTESSLTITIQALLKLRGFDQARQIVVEALQQSCSSLPLSRDFKHLVQREILLLKTPPFLMMQTNSIQQQRHRDDEDIDDDVTVDASDDADAADTYQNNDDKDHQDGDNTNFMMMSAEDRQDLLDSLEFEASRGKDLLSFIISSSSSPHFGRNRKSSSNHRVDDNPVLGQWPLNRRSDF